MAKYSKFILLAAVLVFVLVVGYWLGNSASSDKQVKSKLPGKLEISQDYYNFGTVGLDRVSHSYAIKNVGEGPINIAKISTSCGCTTAQIKKNSAVSRAFGMDHGSLPRADIELMPGEEAEVIVTYDPLAHGLENARGSFRRAVYIRTENPRGEYQLTFDVTVDPDKKTIGPRAEFDRREYDFGKISRQDGVVKTIFKLSNSGDRAFKVDKITTSCGCTSAELSKDEIAPGETVDLVVKFDPNFHQEPQGRLERVVTLFTNMANQPEIEVKIYAEIID